MLPRHGPFAAGPGITLIAGGDGGDGGDQTWQNRSTIHLQSTFQFDTKGPFPKACLGSCKPRPTG